MGKFNFDENKLEQLLQSMPKVRDHQTPEQLYARISSQLAESNEDRHLFENKRMNKKRGWIVPAFASVAALLIISLVVPSFLFQQNSTMEQQTDVNGEQSTDANPLQSENEVGTLGADIKLAKIGTDFQSQVISTITDEEEVITVAVPDPNALFVVPLSFIISKGEALSQIETIKEHLHESEWGLSDYILDGVSLQEGSATDQSKRVVLNVPADHPYGNGSAMETIFLATLRETFRPLGYDIVEFQTEGKPGIVLGNYGDLHELFLTNEETRNVYYLYQPNGQVQSFLVPFPKEKNFVKALEVMKSTTELGLEEIRPAVPAAVQFANVTIDNTTNQVIVEFADGIELQNDASSISMIEAILMTAKDYGFKYVEFKNAPIDLIGPYQLNEPIPVPYGVNPMPY